MTSWVTLYHVIVTISSPSLASVTIGVKDLFFLIGDGQANYCLVYHFILTRWVGKKTCFA